MMKDAIEVASYSRRKQSNWAT
ncbi:hypothetical protein AERO8C_20142 [Aeromonas veronii]|uniref:Uncharacterized protein n=1 Tax=Aeromonas veronii TaxID=654 RepID=A0A653L0S1_AERVE|nr:hypothetical protein AERO8C_20142 [Aeromonas veronii]